MINGTLHKKLTASFLLVVIISIGVSSLSTFFITRYNVQKDFEGYSSQIAKQTKNYVENIMTTVDAVHTQFYCNSDFMKSAAQKTSPYENIMEERRKKISDDIINIAISNSFNLISGITFYSANGLTASFPSKAYTTNQSNEAMNEIQNESWYKEVIAKDGKPLWLSPHDEKVVEGRNDTYLSSISALKDDDGNFIGIIKININVNNINEIIEKSSIGDNGFIFIVGSDKKIIAHKDEALTGTEIDSDLYDKITKDQQVFKFDYQGTSMKGISLESNYTDWKYVAAISQSDLLKTAVNIEKACLVITIICLIGCFFISTKLASDIQKPINKLIDLSKVVCFGKLNVKSEKCGIKEIDELGANFDKIIDDLKKNLVTNDDDDEQKKVKSTTEKVNSKENKE